MVGYAPLFLKAGYDVLIPDQRAHGASGGNFASYGYFESKDVHHWVDWLYQNIHPASIFGLGESMGAAILLQSLQQESRFSGVIAESSFSSFKDIGIDRCAGILHSRILARIFYSIASIYVDAKYGIQLSSVSPEDAVLKSQVPVFLIHGLKDHSISWRHSERIFEKRKSAIQFWRVPDCGHTAANGSHPAEFQKRVLEFLGALAVTP